MIRVSFVLVATAVALLVGCGSDDDGTSTTGTSTSTSGDGTTSEMFPVVDGDVTTPSGTLCDQPYALCNDSECEKVPGTNTSICTCTAEDGFSMGPSPCAKSAPGDDSLVSTFSSVNTADKSSLTCSGGTPWANCYGAKCEVGDDGEVTCNCPLVESSEDFFTFGGDCDDGSCKTTIWSAAAGSDQTVSDYMKAMEQAGQDAVESAPACAESSARANELAGIIYEPKEPCANRVHASAPTHDAHG